jgi:hypothetical protein
MYTENTIVTAATKAVKTAVLATTLAFVLLGSEPAASFDPVPIPGLVMETLTPFAGSRFSRYIRSSLYIGHGERLLAWPS